MVENKTLNDANPFDSGKCDNCMSKKNNFLKLYHKSCCRASSLAALCFFLIRASLRTVCVSVDWLSILLSWAALGYNMTSYSTQHASERGTNGIFMPHRILITRFSFVKRSKVSVILRKITPEFFPSELYPMWCQHIINQNNWKHLIVWSA